MKYLFYNDYSEGAHPRILKALSEENLVQHLGYGEDATTAEAANLIRNLIEKKDAAVHFVSGGTQANLIALASIHKPFEAVNGASTSHIQMHEAGAIEATGHRILLIENPEGKISVPAIGDS